MNAKITDLLLNRGGNYILPFFWQHGEDEATLRKYMEVIDEANIKAVCVESRPHPDYCGPKWWEDMDIIMEEARKRDMKVWILDDSHFPTGFANGAMESQPDERCRQSICCRTYDCAGKEELQISQDEILHPDEFKPSMIEEMIAKERGGAKQRQFEDDRLIGLYAVRTDAEKNGFLEEAYRIDLMGQLEDNILSWKVPEGSWKVYALHLTRNRGPHRNYINMMDRASCKVLLDAVYEPHYVHYKEDFGKTLAGFFSDEPELGNGHLYVHGNVLGVEDDLPWSMELEEILKKEFGPDFTFYMALLWEDGADPSIKAKIRYAYMDAVSRLVEEDFSMQMGSWCRERGVQYIGHMIEDNNQHARTGSSLGHFFRGLGGQDMAGIDDIGGQVFPQGEDISYDKGPFQRRDGEFYHYMLGKLGSSHAAIDPLKNGDSMCEIFGAYGWSEGVRLEKYLVDHFAVRGINHFVPHAFSAKAFPDPDCPPHFYAHGNNPQYRHFGKLMAYTNRVCELISGGRHVSPVAVLYHGEGEWTGTCMFSHRVGHVLADSQIEYDYIPQDVFAEPERFRTSLRNGMLAVNTQEYRAVIVPTMQFVTKRFAEYVAAMCKAGVLVYFVDAYPEGICDLAAEEATSAASLVDGMKTAGLIALADIISELRANKVGELVVVPENNRLRYYHYEHHDGTGIYLFVNEGTEVYEGEVMLDDSRTCYRYDAWENCLGRADYAEGRLKVAVEPMKSLIVVFDKNVTVDEIEAFITEAPKAEGTEIPLNGSWRRSICRSIDYPDFRSGKEITLPDKLEVEEPEFSGFVRYENSFDLTEKSAVLLQITDAYEGVEVFVNGKSLGIQVVAPYLYDMTDVVKEGRNQVAIEVATTLEREMSKIPSMFGMPAEPVCPSGINGVVKIIRSQAL